ncbi:hypothetical protein [Gordonia phthalatica]|uniref:ApeA N-terminal domain-containing protein n=1 Tax=Gordonia phthalatica TaxID=1136941 RepID=A0A0N9MUS6_9ACTN|nr:hypothetical protein [Gordonia phthalatica]ALG86373.1 hypothetical protein ACH46_20100 [Gordonia phthalatica]
MAEDEIKLIRDRGSIEPGEYDCEWTIDGQQVRGYVELRAGRPPIGYARTELFDGAIPSQPGRYARSYPSSSNVPVVRGYIDSQMKHVTFFDVRLTAEFTERTRIAGAVALVSNVELPDDVAFTSMTTQVTQIERFSGLTPIDSRIVSGGAPREFGITTTTMKREWRGEQMSATFSYGYRSIIDPFILSVRFTPWIEFTSSTPMDATTWLRQWCLPLVTLISVATGAHEKPTLVRLATSDGKVTAAIFASPVSQEPYYCMKESSDILAFTASDKDFSLPQVLTLLNNLRNAGHPLIVGYNTVALGNDQHPQGRLLLLLQWLEASYGFDHRSEFDAQQEKHTAERDSLLDKLKTMKDNGELTSQEWKLAKRIPRFAQPTLSEALSHYFKLHSELNVRAKLDQSTLIRETIATSEANNVIEALVKVRNGLSHGTSTYDVFQLLETVNNLHPLVRAEYLHLLGGSFNAHSLR